MLDTTQNAPLDLVINWHLLEQCNFHCKYCYASWDRKNTVSWIHEHYIEMLDEIRGLAFSRANTATGPLEIGHIRLNLAGGEPFLVKSIGEIITAAAERGLNPSFISNGSLITSEFASRFARHISTAGFSIDSARPDTNRAIGRENRAGHLLNLTQLAGTVARLRAENPTIKIKLNTVVCAWNYEEDMRPVLDILQPERWKVLRVLPGNSHGNAISDAQFKTFTNRHRDVAGMVVEDNVDMRGSYLMIDPLGRFFQNTCKQGYISSPPILDVGIHAALNNIPFYPEIFSSRY